MRRRWFPQERRLQGSSSAQTSHTLSADASQSRSWPASRELPFVAYRTRRAFRAQYDLLLAASSLEEALARLEAPGGALGRHLNRRLARDVELRRLALAAELHQFRSETMDRLAPSDLLSGVSRVVLEYGASLAGFEAPATPSLTARVASVALGKSATYACLAAWAVTADQILVRGITNRPSLIAAELTALALSPGAVFPSPD
jgi:hypothetical protein